MKKRLRILVVPAWYPSPENEVAGVFVRDQARAIALRDDVDDVTVLAPFSRTASDRVVDNGVTVVRLRATRWSGRPLRALDQYRSLSAAVARLRMRGTPRRSHPCARFLGGSLRCTRRPPMADASSRQRAPQ